MKRYFLGVVSLAFLGAAAAHAQTEQEDDIDAILGLDTAPAPAPTQTSQPPVATPLPSINAPETYVVRFGDTLWDLCAKFLNNPWYWPKIWSYNPGLDNPHWIRPGTVLRFYPQPEESPVAVESAFEMPADAPNMALVPAPMDAPVDAPPVTANELNMADFQTPADQEVNFSFDDLPLFETTNDIQNVLDRVPDANVTRRRVTVFVEDEFPAEAGELSNAVSNASFLSSGDIVYLDLKTDVTMGDTFQIYRHRQEIKHPVSGGRMGSIVEVVGEVLIQGQARGKFVGSISQVFQPAFRGDKVGPIADMSIREIRPQTNGLAMRGYVMSAAGDPRSNLGQHDLIFIDKGNKDGVQVGNTFYVLRGEDQLFAKNIKIPDEIIAQVMIIDVRNSVSTGVLLFSNRSIKAGDRVEMRPSGS
ncbi:MAG: hypothetical protein CMH56_14645 [Myxococcales bacterium]|nr:hypothetical protein [Myxococcales bacterium]